MKKIVNLLLVLFPIAIISQTQTENYIKTVTYKTPTQTAIVSPTVSQAATTVTYFDGLGRPVQKVLFQQSPSAKDIVAPIEYDIFGRQTKEYLPFASTQNTAGYISPTMLFTDLIDQYKNKFGVANDNPFSEKVLESSPLNRILKQSAPGNDWKVGSSHEIKIEYQTNIIADSVKLFKAIATWDTASGLYSISLVNGGYYNANLLNKNITYDENSAANPLEANGSTVEFKNKEGQVILKRTYNNSLRHDTYYVYDSYGNLTYVLPPKAVDLIGRITTAPADISSMSVLASGTSLNLAASNSVRLLPGFHAQTGSTFSAVIDVDQNKTTLANLCYQYKYDYRNRLVEKKLPGKQWEFIVYDKLDRLVATGPAYSPFSDLTAEGWIITKYDVFNRPVYTGWMNTTAATAAGRTVLQAVQNDAALTLLNESKLTSGTLDGIAAYYSNTVSPTSFKLLAVNYYDNYTFPSTPAITIPTSVEGQAILTTSEVKGLTTVSWKRVPTISTASLGETTVTFYDPKSRPVRVYSVNHLGGYTYTDSKLDSFSGQLQYNITRHKRVSTDTELTTKDVFTYSAQDRLLTQTHQINGGTIELLTSNSYDELGQLVSKKVGNTEALPIQKVDYTYNIRGWLTEINNMANLQQGTDPKDLFAFRLSYNTTPTNIAGVAALYNGNIAETAWKTNSDLGAAIHGYGYKYDGLNRLINAISQKNSAVNNTYNELLTYDKNGNIMSLQRNGTSDVTATPIDNLDYSYGSINSTNQLIRVADSSNKMTGFIDGSNTGDDFSYDANGNMISDANKNISAITYNQLNLPIKITFGPSGNIVYIYNAIGQKLQKVVTQGSIVTTTDYLGGYQYENSLLKFVPTAEGYVEPSGSSYKYIFQYKDHLGNVRLSYDKTLAIKEESNYYAFGLKQDGYNIVKLGVENKYKYNGKELQDELGLGIYDYGFRNYDPAIGRWNVVDPLAEKSRRWTPYNYCIDNPIRFIDPDGREIINIQGGVRFTGNDAQIMFRGLQQQIKETGGVKPIHFVYQGATPNIYQHTLNAFRNGQPEVLHYDADKSHQKQRRDEALKGHIREPGKSLDEYPYASTFEGGKGADVTNVPIREQNVQGAQLGGFGGVYRTMKTGDAFMVVPVPKDKEPDAVPDPVPVLAPIPTPSPEQVNKVVKPLSTATILTIIGMILLSPLGV